MAERSLVAMMAAGLGSMVTKAAVSTTTFRGPLSEISGVGFPREPFAGAWQRNYMPADTQTLASYSPIYACLDRISGDIAKLGIDLLQDDEEQGIPILAPKTSPYWTVLRRPNTYQNRIQFVRYWMLCKLIWGNAYMLKFRDERGMVNRLYLLDPRRVTPLVTPDGAVYYSISSDDLARIPSGLVAAPASEIIHDRGPTLWHPLVGVPPIFAAALSGTLGLKIQRNSTAFFGNQSRPGGVLKAPGSVDEPAAAKLRKEWNEGFQGPNAGKIALLTNGLEFEALSVVAEQSQTAEQLGISAVDVATAFKMPAYKLNQGAMPTSNNVQALNQQYYTDCLQGYIEDAELCLEEGLEVKSGYTIEFNLEGLLRMDSATQMEVLSKGTKSGLIKPNEGRKRLRLPRVNGGDTVYMQQQDFSIEALAKRDARADPFGKAESPTPAPPPAEPEVDAADDDENDAAADQKAIIDALLQKSADHMAEVRALHAEQLRAAEERRQAEVESAAARAEAQAAQLRDEAQKQAAALAARLEALEKGAEPADDDEADFAACLKSLSEAEAVLV